MRKKILYARTVKSGERPLIVCTRETGMRVMAWVCRTWPPIWKAVNGRVTSTMSRLGHWMPCLRAGTACLSGL